MLQIVIPDSNLWDEKNEAFIPVKGLTLRMEHSLVSLSKWESNWCKPFLSTKDKTFEETLDYVKCMTVTQNVDPNVYLLLTRGDVDRINRYIAAPMTATTFSEDKPNRMSREVVTAELIYSSMIALNIPFECQKWHLNRLLTLIRVCDIKSRPPKKRSRRELARRNSALNAARKKKLNTRG